MAVTYQNMIRANKRNSFWLIILFVLFFVVVAGVIGLGIVAYMMPNMVAQMQIQSALTAGGIAGGIALFISFLSYYAGASFVLGISGAREIQVEDDRVLFHVVEEMAISAGVPMPKVYLIDDSAPNAFATGRDPQHAVVAITTGLRQKLSRDELQAVMAHEIGHIRNYDIRLMLLLAVLIGAIVMLADFFWSIVRASDGFRHSYYQRRSSDSKSKDNGNAIVMILVALSLVLSIIAPILAMMLQAAVSRQREYLADASAVEFTGNPLALANALRKIDSDDEVLEAANRGTAHLYIANPIKQFEARAASYMSSHPPINDRINRLLHLAGEHVPNQEPNVPRL